MAIFLHDPVSTPDHVLRLVRARVPEGRHLDYKAAIWAGAKGEQQEEAGKDVAAFANAEGGDIIVGIDEDAAGVPVFFPRPSVLDDSQFRAWLNNVVVPRDVVASVRIRPITVNHGTAQHTVLVVSVPPWPDGPNCCASGASARRPTSRSGPRCRPGAGCSRSSTDSPHVGATRQHRSGRPTATATSRLTESGCCTASG